jgi:pyridoxine 5-phosphate synthase
MSDEGIRLGVNIDHVATLRQARGTTYPSPIEAARACAEAGAHGLTVHLREDRRHIQDQDVADLKRLDLLPLNLEMAAVEEIVAIALHVCPHEACLVPERRHELTTEGGLDVIGGGRVVASAVERLRAEGIAVSLFIEPDAKQIEAAANLGAAAVELHTGTYCDAASDSADVELDRLIQGARRAHELGLKVNAGHGLHLDNIKGLLRMPYLSTLNIGHSIVSHAVMVGMKEAVCAMLRVIAPYRGGEP